MARGIIYLIQNKQNNHKFIGSTTLAMNKEWVNHIEKSKRMSSEPLHKAFRDLGVHNFMIKQIDECDESLFEEKTNYWIEQHKPEYNPLTIVIKEEKPIQEKPNLVPAVPQKNRPKRSSPHLIQWNEQTRGKKLGFKLRGKNLETGLCTDYDSARIAAEEVTGNPRNNSNILLAARTGRTAYGYKWQILEEKKTKRAVFGVNKKTEQIEVRFDSILSAVKEYGTDDRQGILKSLKNPGRYSWKGYYWFFVSS